jgi:predicted nucleic acid-binding protein
MSAVFADTSYFIALLNRRDPHHNRAIPEHSTPLRTHRPGLTTTAVLAEVGDGFASRGRWDLAGPILRDACADPRLHVVTVDCALLERAVAFRAQRADKRWALTDCISFVVMADHGVTAAMSADRDFVQAGFRAMLLDP